jgi:hypothetical protein
MMLRWVLIISDFRIILLGDKDFVLFDIFDISFSFSLGVIVILSD